MNNSIVRFGGSLAVKFILLCGAPAPAADEGAKALDAYNVVWDSPSPKTSERWRG